MAMCLAAGVRDRLVEQIVGLLAPFMTINRSVRTTRSISYPGRLVDASTLGVF